MSLPAAVRFTLSLASTNCTISRTLSVAAFKPSSRNSILGHAMTQRKNVVFVLGGPGSGKGTLCKRIAQEFGHVHLSAGDLLRDELVRPDSEYGRQIASDMASHTIVPSHITCALFARAMSESAATSSGDGDGDGGRDKDFLIDGFPRNEDNRQGWSKRFGDDRVKRVILLDCDEETCVKRCLGRSRSDDFDAETLARRFRAHVEETMPVVEHFRKMGLVVEVDAKGSPEDVFEYVRKTFEKK